MTSAFLATTSVSVAQAKTQRLGAAAVCADQTAWIAAYALSAWVPYAQFRRDRLLPLLLVTGGTPPPGRPRVNAIVAAA